MKVSTPLEIKLFNTLKRISQYQTPEQLHRGSQKDWGLPADEAIEYAYENVLQEAKRAIKGVRIKLPDAPAIGSAG